jgi:c(7)-type cytochrome triheme protein
MLSMRKLKLKGVVLITLSSLAASSLLISLAWAEYGDVIINNYSTQNGMRPVVFPHWFHRIRFRCSVCHDQLGFIMKKEANMIDMGKIADGQYCGACHNGKTAWAPVYCDRCHTGVRKKKIGNKIKKKSKR